MYNYLMVELWFGSLISVSPTPLDLPKLIYGFNFSMEIHIFVCGTDLASYNFMIISNGTVHGKILEGEIFGKSLLLKQLTRGESAGSLSVIPLYLYNYIGEENVANCIPFAKFTKIFPLHIFPRMVFHVS